MQFLKLCYSVQNKKDMPIIYSEFQCENSLASKIFILFNASYLKFKFWICNLVYSMKLTKNSVSLHDQSQEMNNLIKLDSHIGNEIWNFENNKC